jgi:hypothetical protein
LDDLLDQHWSAIENDLQDAGVDLGDPVLIRTRTWRWLALRIEGLLNRPPIGYVRVPVDDERERSQPLWGTRVQQAVYDTEEG